MNYREIYEEVFDRSKPPTTPIQKIKQIAQLLYAEYRSEEYTKDDATWEALEQYEDMCGNYFDATYDQFDDIKSSLN